MESPLKTVYELAKQADAATMQQDYPKASGLYKEAATKCTEALQLSENETAIATLMALAKQYSSRSEFLLRIKNVRPANTSDVAKRHTSIQTELTTSLASARGIPVEPSFGMNTLSSTGSSVSTPAVPVSNGFSNSTNGTSVGGFPNIPSPNTSAILNKFYQDVAVSYLKDMEKAEKEGEVGYAPGESFFIVPKNSNLKREELIVQNANLQQLLSSASTKLAAYDKVSKRHKEAFKAGMAAMRNEIASHEARFVREYEAEFDKLKTENDKLKIQISKMKSRWDDLKESARKKRS